MHKFKIRLMNRRSISLVSILLLLVFNLQHAHAATGCSSVANSPYSLEMGVGTAMATRLTSLADGTKKVLPFFGDLIATTAMNDFKEGVNECFSQIFARLDNLESFVYGANMRTYQERVKTFSNQAALGDFEDYAQAFSTDAGVIAQDAIWGWNGDTIESESSTQIRVNYPQRLQLIEAAIDAQNLAFLAGREYVGWLFTGSGLYGGVDTPNNCTYPGQTDESFKPTRNWYGDVGSNPPNVQCELPGYAQNGRLTQVFDAGNHVKALGERLGISMGYKGQFDTTFGSGEVYATLPSGDWRTWPLPSERRNYIGECEPESYVGGPGWISFRDHLTGAVRGRHYHSKKGSKIGSEAYQKCVNDRNNYLDSASAHAKRVTEYYAFSMNSWGLSSLVPSINEAKTNTIQIYGIEGLRDSDRTARVTLYKDAYYSGTQIRIGLGRYSKNDLVGLGMPNNTVSSAKLPAGLMVEAFDGENFNNKLKNWTYSRFVLGLHANKLSSAIVKRDLPLGIYKIRVADTNLCLTIGGYRQDNNANVYAKTCNNDDAQSFYVAQQANGKYHIVAYHSNKCWGFYGHGDSGDNVHQYSCGMTSTRQSFGYERSGNRYTFQNVDSGLWVEVKNNNIELGLNRQWYELDRIGDFPLGD